MQNTYKPQQLCPFKLKKVNRAFGRILVALAITGTSLFAQGTAHVIAVNQVGYKAGLPKRFTAPLTSDGAIFSIKTVGSDEALYQGQVSSKIGDFSDFKPIDSKEHYVVELKGGELAAATSDPFLIRGELYEEQFLQSAVDFLIDTRAVVGTHPSAFGGCPWRDGTYYDAILPSLVLFLMAYPEEIAAMPRQIDWASDRARILSPDFKFDAKNRGTGPALQTTRNYYELEPPKDNAPDVVQLIHWGAGYYLSNPVTADPSNDPAGKKIHSQTIEQLSYVIWAWPHLEQWLPQSFYDQVLGLCFEQWEKIGALGIPQKWHMSSYQLKTDKWGGMLHPYKGRHAPGHSIVPNILMHEVAKREGREDAARYLDAAVAQAAWIIENIDWNDPRTTKGHRVGEHRTIPNLVWLLQKYPEHAPEGLREKIADWVKVAVSRSDNLWDFRRYDMESHWTIPKMNDLGNTIGFPSIALAASWALKEDEAALRDRLRITAVGAMDHLFGRNPKLAAAPSRPQLGFLEVERGWPKEYKLNVCARLEDARGSLSSLPGSEMYPFKPDSEEFRHPEGWVNYGAAWCISLSYLRFDALQTTPEL
ncbi:MAG: hypothetical protein KJO21_11770 [Verrucomicrobiae bacterium]|nr:hypothetical protein [Verrucomicrobiae bacterium]NNJ44036.1 hypothetical protein [Akkermansiaceae bacterium]